MPTYTLDEIKQAQDTAIQLGMIGCGVFCLIKPEEAQKACNGIGASWMPESARKICDKRYKDLQIPAMIHDVQYEYGTGTDEDFRNANYNLYVNGCIMAKSRYGWYNPLRYLVMHDAKKLAGICDLFGKVAYEEAVRAHKESK